MHDSQSLAQRMSKNASSAHPVTAAVPLPSAAIQVSTMAAGNWKLRAPGHDDHWGCVALFADRGTVTVRAGEELITLQPEHILVAPPAMEGALLVTAEEGAIVLRLAAPFAAVHAQALTAAAGRPISVAQSGTAGLMSHMLRALASESIAIETEASKRVARHVAGLLAAMCEAPGVQQSRTLLDLAKDVIEDRLGDEDLNPDQIAREINVSTRTLYRLFEAEGLTIAGWIRQRRLEHCRQDLFSDSSESTTISAIGVRWGLPDAAHFSRLFKSAYGVSPREFRAMHRKHECDARCLRATA